MDMKEERESERHEREPGAAAGEQELKAACAFWVSHQRGPRGEAAAARTAPPGCACPRIHA